MKNIEKYYDEIMGKTERGNFSLHCIIYRIKNNYKGCKGISCEDCILDNFKWLNAEYQEPIKLTHAEKVILENLDENATHIKRQKGGLLMLGILEVNCFKVIGIKSELFQFVEDEPLEIAWLLENCEVIEDEH